MGRRAQGTIVLVQQSKITVDTSRVPLVVQRMSSGFGDSCLEHMFRQFELLFHAGRRYALIVYCDPDSNIMTARQRKRVSDWHKQHAEQIKRINVATAVVIESSLVRGTMTAMNWLIEPLTPQRNVRSIKEALDFCLVSLQGAKVEVPSEVFALVEAPERQLKRMA